MVEIETWGQSEGRIGTRRDWIIRDYSNGEVIGRATRCISISYTSNISRFPVTIHECFQLIAHP